MQPTGEPFFVSHILPQGDALPATPQWLEIAERYVWWVPPQEALEYPGRLLAQLMTLGTWDDVQWVKAQVGPERLREVLANPPP